MGMEEEHEVIIEEKKPLLRRISTSISNGTSTSTIRRTVRIALQQLALPTTTYIMKSMGGGDVLSPARSSNHSPPDRSLSEARSLEDDANNPDGKGKSIVRFIDAMGHGRVLSSDVLGMKLNHYWMKECRQIFDMYDKNGDNVINVEELRGILEILGYSPTPEEVKTILERFDQDKSGTIDFDEYLVLIQHWIEQDEEQIYEAFKVFDKDGDGFVSAQELKRALTQYGEQFTEEEANEFFNMMDTDGDGVINYEEFVEYLRSMQKYSTE